MAAKSKKKKKTDKGKKTARKKSAARKTTLKKSARVKKPAAKAGPRARVRSRGKRENVESVVFEPKGLGARSGGQSGDLQGLSNNAGADAESVDELLEEGNAFEAEVVKGVEDALDADEGEIHTHEVPEDDVPDEYRDGDEEGGPSRRGKTQP